MAKFRDKPRHSTPKTPGFLCCFGFSGKVGRFKTLKPGHDRKRKRLFSWMRLQARTPPVAKTITIPDHSSIPGGKNALFCTFPAERNTSKANFYRLTSRSTAPTSTTYKPRNEDPTAAVPMAAHRADEKKPEPVKPDKAAAKINLESCKHSDLPKKRLGQTRFSFTRKIESIRTARFAQPILPMKKNPNCTDPTPSVSHSLSPPPPNPNRRSQVEDPSTGTRVRLSTDGAANGEMGKKCGSVLGMSILVITLAIMLLWGRLCAILCTAAWFYVVTSLRSALEETGKTDLIKLSESNSYIEEYKKKSVVFRGFLDRN